MKRAILSDIHGNWEALKAVLDDAQAQGVEQFVCLGDIVGYGPNPAECIDAVRNFPVIVLGNHDQAALFDPEGFSSGAERAIFWTRRHLETADPDPQRTRSRLEFLCRLPRCHIEHRFLFVHGSARNPLNEYVFPEDIYNARKIEKIFALIPQYCFQGHTHVPGVFTHDSRFLSPCEIQYHYVLGNEKVMINVGSVGQPRDGDYRASYLILEDNQVWFRRVDYPVEVTVRKIYAIPELDNYLGDRLREGR
ncbi:MAG: phosphoesterase [Pirellulaceae bacterium]|nr:MAG: phosphoesterase [Pirellulaceae bacterium]